MKYLMIFEDGEFSVSDQIQEGDFDSVMAGILDIIRFKDGNFEQWYDGEWLGLEGES